MDIHSASDKKIFAINPDLQKQVSPILTNMVSMLLKKKPQDPVSVESHHNQLLSSLTITSVALYNRCRTSSNSWRNCKERPLQVLPKKRLPS